MEVFGIAIIAIAGGIMLIITTIYDRRRNIVLRERFETHKRIVASLNRYRWLYKMGYQETACLFIMIG